MELLEKVVKGLECIVNGTVGPLLDDCKKAGCEYLAQGDCEAEIMADALALIRQQQERIKELEAGQKWISVKDRLPEQEKTVIVARKYVQPGHKDERYVETAELIGSHWVSVEDEYKVHRQFHTLPYAWMPLPEPPKEEEHEAD